MPQARCTYLLVFVFILGCSNSKEETIISVPHAIKHLKAEIVVQRGTGFFSEKCFLQIVDSTQSTPCRVEHDLHEGFGGYESGVMRMKWLSDDTVLIERRIADAPNNLLYSLTGNNLIEIGDSLTTHEDH